MTNNDKRTFLRSRKAISPILAVVVLLGITVVAGGLVFTLFTSSATTASTVDSILLQNAQAVKGTDHSDFTVNVKNAGSVSWTEVSLTIAKTELSEPIIYESLHEVVMGCDSSATETVDLCNDDDTNVAGSRDNPMRAQWLASLDKMSGDELDQADFGEGIAAGRKLVFQDKDDSRTISIMDGTAVAMLFGDTSNSKVTKNSNMSTCTPTTSGVTCIDVFKDLDPKVKGDAIFCKLATGQKAASGVYATCDIFTHKKITTIPPGESVFFYADMFVKAVEGLDNQFVSIGDNLVINVATKSTDGGTGRSQTIVKVTGL